MTVARVIRLTRQAPRGVADRWEHFWAGIAATGDGGDVLWDADDSDEAPRYRHLLATHACRGLPLVDVGCGNGRFTRALAPGFPMTVGVDRSPAAVARARAETAADRTEITYRALDVTAPGAGRLLRADLGGDANVFVRGVFHILDGPARRKAADAVATLVGARGVALLAETNHRGPRLEYLECLGAGPRGIPPALARVIAAGLPPPFAFGEPELADCFPPERWRRVMVDADATITTIPSRAPWVRDTVAGFVAVLAPRDQGA